MPAKTTYKQLVLNAREAVLADLEQNPDEWRDPEHFFHLTYNEVKEMVVPEDADFEWAVPILREKPELLERENAQSFDAAIYVICAAIEEQVVADVTEMFQATADRLMDPDFDNDIDRVDGVVIPRASKFGR